MLCLVLYGIILKESELHHLKECSSNFRNDAPCMLDDVMVSGSEKNFAFLGITPNAVLETENLPQSENLNLYITNVTIKEDYITIKARNVILENVNWFANKMQLLQTHSLYIHRCTFKGNILKSPSVEEFISVYGGTLKIAHSSFSDFNYFLTLIGTYAAKIEIFNSTFQRNKHFKYLLFGSTSLTTRSCNFMSNKNFTSFFYYSLHNVYSTLLNISIEQSVFAWNLRFFSLVSITNSIRSLIFCQNIVKFNSKFISNVDMMISTEETKILSNIFQYNIGENLISLFILSTVSKELEIRNNSYTRNVLQKSITYIKLFSIEGKAHVCMSNEQFSSNVCKNHYRIATHRANASVIIENSSLNVDIRMESCNLINVEEHINLTLFNVTLRTSEENIENIKENCSLSATPFDLKTIEKYQIYQCKKVQLHYYPVVIMFILLFLLGASTKFLMDLTFTNNYDIFQCGKLPSENKSTQTWHPIELDKTLKRMKEKQQGNIYNNPGNDEVN